jgi:hypothetical protein
MYVVNAGIVLCGEPGLTAVLPNTRCCRTFRKLHAKVCGVSGHYGSTLRQRCTVFKLVFTSLVCRSFLLVLLLYLLQQLYVGAVFGG